MIIIIYTFCRYLRHPENRILFLILKRQNLCTFLKDRRIRIDTYIIYRCNSIIYRAYCVSKIKPSNVYFRKMLIKIYLERKK